MQETETKSVNGPYKQTGQAVEGFLSEPVLHPMSDPVLQLVGGTLGEGKRHDRLGRPALGEQICHSLRYDLGLPGAGGGDDLEVPAAMANCVQRRPRQLRTRWAITAE